MPQQVFPVSTALTAHPLDAQPMLIIRRRPEDKVEIEVRELMKKLIKLAPTSLITLRELRLTAHVLGQTSGTQQIYNLLYAVLQEINNETR